MPKRYTIVLRLSSDTNPQLAEATEEELYDEVADPYETKNLANSPDHQKVLIELRSAVDRWIEESNDQGRQLEPPEIAAAKGATKADGDPNSPAGGKAARQKAKKQKTAKEAK